MLTFQWRGAKTELKSLKAPLSAFGSSVETANEDFLQVQDWMSGLVGLSLVDRSTESSILHPELAGDMPRLVNQGRNSAAASAVETRVSDAGALTAQNIALPANDIVSVMGAPDGSSLGSQNVSAAPAELLVQFVVDAGSDVQSTLLTAVGGHAVQTLRSAADGAGDLVLVKFTSAPAAAAAMTALGHNPQVKFAESNSVFGAQGANDAYYTGGNLWGMYGDATTPANSFGSQAGEAWAAGVTGSTSVVVGVIDTGLDYAHSDLYLNVWLNQGEIPMALRGSLVDTDGDKLITFRDLNQTANAAYARDLNANGRIDAGDLLADPIWENGTDDDGNSYRDDLIGWDFVNSDNDPYDDNNHGTHVSGTIAGIGGNGIGVAGVNWAAQVMPLKFLSNSGSGSLSNAILAQDYYTKMSKISGGNFVGTNNSWGGGSFSQALQDVITLAAKQDLLFIAAAGNGGSDGVGDNNDAVANYPSNYSTLATAGYEAVVAVAAITSTGARAGYSNYGATTVDIGAPGSSIISTIAGGGYGSFSGTSMATPHVTGALALLASVAPQMTASELRNALLASAAPTGSLAGMTLTGGRLDVPALLARAPVPDVVAPSAAFSPVNGATGVALNSDIVVTFSEAVLFRTGTITILDEAGAIFETYDVAISSANLRLSGTSLVINPNAEFAAMGRYTVSISAGAVADLAGNVFVAPAYGFTAGTLALPVSLVGTAGADELLGDSGNDMLDGKAGDDVLNGREGGDLYLIVSATDHNAAEIADSGTNGVDEVRFASTVASTLTLFAGDIGIERVVIGTGTAATAVTTATTALNINASALTYGVSMTGNAGANILTGGAGNDTLTGGAGVDTFNITSGTDVITDLGAGGVDVINVSAGATLNATVTAAWRASATTVNNGVVNLTTNGFSVDLAAITSTAAGNVGYRVTNTGAATALTGSALADTLTGGTGNDTLNGSAGVDVLDGGEGSDLYIIAASDDHGGAEFGDTGLRGTDEVRFTATVASTLTLFANDIGIERIVIGTGTAATAVTTATTALNVNASALTYGVSMTGNAGANILTGGAGNDTLTGGAGVDTFNITSGTDVITDLGAGGVDVINVSAGATLNATVTAAWRASATTVNNGVVNLTTNGFSVDLAAITSTAAGNVGYRVTNTGAATALTGSALADTLTGGTGNDTLNGSAGVDVLDGGEGSDLYIIAASDDHGGAEFGDTGLRGTDEVRFTATVASTLTLFANDIGIERIVIGTGTAATAVTTATTALNVNASALTYGVSMTGNAGANILTGGAGNDTLTGGAGNDTLNGGAGFDYADYSTSTAATTVNLTLTTAQNTGSSGTDLLSGIEGVIGGSGADTLIGDTNANILSGNAGNDTLNGGGGDDQLRGGNGNDVLTGGAGADLFIFDVAANTQSNRDTINDFLSGADKLQFSRAAFTGMPVGALSVDAFWSGAGVTAAHDATDRFIYNTTTGILYFDPDGNGRQAAVQVALLGATTPSALAYTDIQIIL